MKCTKFISRALISVILPMLFIDTWGAQETRMINFIHEAKALDEILTMMKEDGKTGMLSFQLL